MTSRWIRLASAIAASVLLSACGRVPPTETVTQLPPATQLPPYEAYISSIDIEMSEIIPVQVDVVVKGSLHNGCQEIGETTQSFDPGNRAFTLKVMAFDNGQRYCTEALRSFEKRVRLDGVAGLAKGTYTVNANNMSATFTLMVDNGPLATP